MMSGRAVAILDSAGDKHARDCCVFGRSWEQLLGVDEGGFVAAPLLTQLLPN